MLRSNVSKVVLLTFFARLHFYIHVYSLLLQDRGLSLFEINAQDSIVLFAMFATEVPTGGIMLVTVILLRGDKIPSRAQ